VPCTDVEQRRASLRHRRLGRQSHGIDSCHRGSLDEAPSLACVARTKRNPDNLQRARAHGFLMKDALRWYVFVRGLCLLSLWERWLER
jgi:hypothetical protein